MGVRGRWTDRGRRVYAPCRCLRARASLTQWGPMAAEYEPFPEKRAPDQPSKHDSAKLALLVRVADVERLISAGYTDAQIRHDLRQRHGCSMPEGNQAIRLARMLQLRMGGLSRDELRAQGNAMILATYRRAIERRRPMTKGVGPGIQDIVYVDDPDGPTEAKMVDAFLRFHGLYVQQDQGGMSTALLVQIQNILGTAPVEPPGATPAVVVEQPSLPPPGDDE